MKYTVYHFLEELKNSTYHIAAGSAGMNREIGGCSLLDYEYDEKFKEKYMPTAFQKHDFILSSMQYAKAHPFWLLEAVKAMIARGCSGLLIDNVYRLPIDQTVISYADTMQFPIIIVEDTGFSMVEGILLIHRKIQQYRSLTDTEWIVDEILRGALNPKEQLQKIHAINASLDDDHAVLYFRSKQPMTEQLYLKIEELYQKHPVMTASDSIFLYKNGFMIIYSCELFTTSNIHEIIDTYIAVISEYQQLFYIGASNIHHTLNELADAIRESLYASGIQTYLNDVYTVYGEMGIYQILMPYASSTYMEDYTNAYLQSLKDYDAQHHTQLFDTAISFVVHNGNLELCASMMKQHINTLRYRLKQISAIIGGNVLSFQYYENLSAAVKIHICQECMQVYKESRFPS